MVDENLNMDDLISDMLESIGDREEPKRENGWVSFSELMENARGYTENQVRDKASMKAKSGEWESVKWGRWTYYRVKK